MNEHNKGGLGVLFLYIGIGIALLFTSISGIQTYFKIINHLIFSNTITWYQLHNSTEMPMNAAFLLVSFIVLVILVRKTRNIVNDYRGTIWYTLCRTIIFIILTVSIALIGVAVSILFGDIFSGEILLNNFLKTIFVAAVGSAVFYYYHGILQGVWRTRKKQERLFVATVSTIVGLIVCGAIIIFNPFERPALKRTYETLGCVQSVSYTLTDAYLDEEGEGLPATDKYTEFLENNTAMHHHIKDRECVNANISYELISKTEYRLCAFFDAFPKGTTISHYPYKKFEVKEIGQNCFETNVEKEYRP